MAISLGTTFTNSDGTTTTPKTVLVVFVPAPNMDQRSPLKIQGRWQGRPALKPGVPVEMKPEDASEIMKTVGTIFYAREDGSPIPRTESDESGSGGNKPSTSDDEEPEPASATVSSTSTSVPLSSVPAPVPVPTPEPPMDDVQDDAETEANLPNFSPQHAHHLNLELDLAKTHEKELELELALESAEEK